jgi:hypothetical protein
MEESGGRRGVVRLVALAVTLMAFPASIAAEQPARLPATVLLIRHAEKPDTDDPNLSPLGFERARLIPRLFGAAPAPPPHNLPRPDALFAARPTRRSNRPLETLTPLSGFLKLPINSDFAEYDVDDLAALLLGGRFAGKVVLVAWHHGALPELAEALGAIPPYDPWPDGQFDRIWRIDYGSGRAMLADLPQVLLPGDSVRTPTQKDGGSCAADSRKS